MCLFEVLQRCENKNEQWQFVAWLENIAKEAAESRLKCRANNGHKFKELKLRRGMRYLCKVCGIACINPELANKRLKEAVKED